MQSAGVAIGVASCALAVADLPMSQAAVNAANPAAPILTACLRDNSVDSSTDVNL